MLVLYINYVQSLSEHICRARKISLNRCGCLATRRLAEYLSYLDGLVIWFVVLFRRIVGRTDLRHFYRSLLVEQCKGGAV